MRSVLLSVLILSACDKATDEAAGSPDATTGSEVTTADGQDASADSTDGSDGQDGSASQDSTDGTDGADSTDGSSGADSTDSTDSGADGSDGTAVACTPGEAKCNGGSVVTCSADGTQETTTPCASGTCAFGACTDACTPGATYCEGDAVVTCGSNKRTTKAPCEAGCTDGACKTVAPVCTPDVVACDVPGKKLVICAADGLSAASKEACPFGCAEGATVCSEAACESGATRCAPDDPKTVELCLEDQSGWKKAESACKNTCKNGSCFVPSCESGVTQCGTLGVETCNDEGTAFEPSEPCKAGCLTTESGPVCKLCKKGLKQCDGSQIEQCLDETEGFVSTGSCSDIQACSNGGCIDIAVISNGAGVDKNYTVLFKAMAACLLAATPGSCRAIDSTELSLPITLDDLHDWFCASEDDAAFQASFGSDAIYLAVADVVGGCTFFDTNIPDLTLEQDEITPGKSGSQCIGFVNPGFLSNGKEIVVDLCTAFK